MWKMCSFSFFYAFFSQPYASCSSRLIFLCGTFGLRPTVNTWMIEFSFSGTWCSGGHEWSLLHSLQWECPHFCRRADDLLWKLWNGVSEQSCGPTDVETLRRVLWVLAAGKALAILGRCMVCLTSLWQVTIPTSSIMRWICVRCSSYFC